MIITMRDTATEQEIRAVLEKLDRLEIETHRIGDTGHTILATDGPIRSKFPVIEVMDGVKEVLSITSPFKLANRAFNPEGTLIKIKEVVIGGPEIVIMAGPCAVENERQVLEIAYAVSRCGARVLRGGAFKPRTSPYSFQGLGEQGLKYLRTAANLYDLLVVSEVMEPGQTSLLAEYVDILQIGARNMQNFNLLREAGRSDKPVLLKRGPAATIEETLLAAEYIMAGGNHQVMICERGIRTFEQSLRNTFDLAAIPVLKSLSHLPVIADPSHATGKRDKVEPIAMGAVAGGADGLLIEVHNEPEKALCDGPQSLLPEQLERLTRRLRLVASAVDRRIGPDRETGLSEQKLMSSRVHRVEASEVLSANAGNGK